MVPSPLLTIGVVCRNGMPFLSRCLDSLPAVQGVAANVEYLLVDAASTDGTLQAMTTFASGRTDTRVYSMSGRVNLSATRNIVLKHAAPGAVFLVDGDVAVDPRFLEAALSELEADTCEIVFGQLPETLHDGNCRPIGTRHDRYGVVTRSRRKEFSGVVLLGPRVVAAGIRYDERLRKAEDVDLAVRLNRRFRILALPISMGTHYTVNYYHPDRVRAWYSEANARVLGTFARKHILRPDRIWHGRKIIAGVAFGIGLQLVLLVALASGSPLLLATAGVLIALDLVQMTARKRLSHYVPVRLVGAWLFAFGVLVPDWDRPRFKVRLVHAMNDECENLVANAEIGQ